MHAQISLSTSILLSTSNLKSFLVYKHFTYYSPFLLFKGTVLRHKSAIGLRACLREKQLTGFLAIMTTGGFFNHQIMIHFKLKLILGWAPGLDLATLMGSTWCHWCSLGWPSPTMGRRSEWPTPMSAGRTQWTLLASTVGRSTSWWEAYSISKHCFRFHTQRLELYFI